MQGRRQTILITNCANANLLEKQRRARCDVAYLDLEDGVAEKDKQSARDTAVRVLREWNYEGKERWVRVNPLSMALGMRDILEIVPSRPDAFVLSKVRHEDEIRHADYLISRREEELGLPVGAIKIAPMVETGAAFMRMESIVRASPRVIGLNLGAEDLSVDLKIVRTDGEVELDYIRRQIVIVAHALGVEAYDVATVRLRDDEAIYQAARRAYRIGFDGKKVISPSQVPAVERGFAPSQEEVARAERLLSRQQEATLAGEAVYALDDRMVDAPFIEQAEAVLRRSGGVN